MGITKTALFNQEVNHLASIFKALGHPARLAILNHLIEEKACICGDLVNVLPLAQATVSQHLKELKLAGLIQGNIEGNSICYCVNPKEIEKIKNFMEFIYASSDKTNKCC